MPHAPTRSCALLLLLAACATPTTIALPPVEPTAVTKIEVTYIRDAEKTERVVTDPATIGRILGSGAFAKNGWERATEKIAPHYRIDLIAGETVLRTYLLGVNNDPPRFPCYELCTGWWIGFDGERTSAILKKGLSDNVWFRLSQDLFGR